MFVCVCACVYVCVSECVRACVGLCVYVSVCRRQSVSDRQLEMYILLAYDVFLLFSVTINAL